MDWTTRESHLQQIVDQGYTIVENVIEPDVTDALLADVSRLERELNIALADNDFEGRSTLRIHNLLAHGALYQQIAVNPRILPIVDLVLGPGCLVSMLGSIDIGPGETAQPIHADDQIIPMVKPHRAVVCNTMWALTDFTEENGATRIIPGSHLADRSPEYGAHYDSQPAEMSRGSVLIWHGSLWHGGGANNSVSRRVGISLIYCAGYLRQEENQQLGIPPDLVRGFPPRLRELVGYGVYMGVLGHIDKMSPAMLLDHEKAADTAEEARRQGDATIAAWRGM
jgi:ectoine hydroxylase-related dioxygenase (phytanoyl-CoA dioxygenase family)